jgi:anthranilate synthase component 2
VLLLDNRDSFVYNLARYVRELGADAVVRRSDTITVGDVESLSPSHIIISPGPCTPAEAGVSTAVIQELGERTPILGVCLGHQCIGAAYGAAVVRAARPVHGRTSRIVHDGSGIFSGLPSPFTATRYHSLIVAKAALPGDLRIIATADDDGEIMAVQHVRYPVTGLQFHPESAASEWGYSLLGAFLHGAGARRLSPTADALAS